MGKVAVTTKKGGILPKALGLISLLCAGVLFDSGPVYFSNEEGSLFLVQMDMMESVRRNWISYALYLAGICWLIVELIPVVKSMFRIGKVSPAG